MKSTKKLPKKLFGPENCKVRVKKNAELIKQSYALILFVKKKKKRGKNFWCFIRNNWKKNQNLIKIFYFIESEALGNDKEKLNFVDGQLINIQSQSIGKTKFKWKVSWK